MENLNNFEYEYIESDENIPEEWISNPPLPTANVQKLVRDSKAETRIEDGKIPDLLFVKIIEKVGKCLLEKSQTPIYKRKKKAALGLVIAECIQHHGVVITEQQVKKKLDNLKLRLKSKVDRKKTGNIPIVLNAADKLLLELLDAEDNPSITPLSYGITLNGSTSSTSTPSTSKLNGSTSLMNSTPTTSKEPVKLTPSSPSAKRQLLLTNLKTTFGSSAKLKDSSKTLEERTKLEKEKKMDRQEKLFQRQMEILQAQEQVCKVQLEYYQKKLEILKYKENL